MPTVIPPEVAMVLIGVLSSLAVSYAPKLREWFGKLSRGRKAAFILTVNVAIAVGLAVNQVGLDWAVILLAGWKAFVALAASQVTYLLNPNA